MMTNDNSNNNQFNAAHILLRHPSSFMMDDRMMYQQESKTCHPPSPYESEPILDDVPQRLAPEQYQYEFPPKSHLQALSIRLDQSIEDTASFFDASSFTTTTCTTLSTTSSSRVSSVLTDDFNAQEDQEFNSFLATLELEQYQQQQQQEDHRTGFSLSPPPIQNEDLVLDRQLSPLQLPQQVPAQPMMMTSSTRLREESYDSISTITQPIVAPASFLSQQQDYDDRRYYAQQESQIEWHDTFGAYPPLWQDTVDDYSYNSVHPHHRLSEDDDLPVIRRESEMVLSDGGHGFMDDSSSNFSTGSKVVLIKLCKKTKMASPYLPKRTTTSHSSSDEGYDDNDAFMMDSDDDEEYDKKELPIESASVFLPVPDLEEDRTDAMSLLKQQQQQIDRLESQLREEKAMRAAFEKAMEEMVVLMDQQQKMLYDRVDQEVAVRQMYEKKMDDALCLVAPLESKLKKETDARCELESMMSHVLSELEEIKQTQQQKPVVSPPKKSASSSSRSVSSVRAARKTLVPATPSSTHAKPIADKRSLVRSTDARSTRPVATRPPLPASSSKKYPSPTSSRLARSKTPSSSSRPPSRLTTTTTTTTTTTLNGRKRLL